MNFVEYQSIGDSILWIASVTPQYIKQEELYMTIGKNSYYQCFKLVNKKIDVYEELADNFEKIVQQIKVQKIIHF
jgi:hypothetical protein